MCVCDTPVFFLLESGSDTLLLACRIVVASMNGLVAQKDGYPKCVSLGKISPSFFFFLVNIPSSVPWLASLLCPAF